MLASVKIYEDTGERENWMPKVEWLVELPETVTPAEVFLLEQDINTTLETHPDYDSYSWYAYISILEPPVEADAEKIASEFFERVGRGGR